MKRFVLGNNKTILVIDDEAHIRRLLEVKLTSRGYNIITARISPDDRNWVRQLRDTLFMEKPFSPAKLLKSIDDYLEIER